MPNYLSPKGSRSARRRERPPGVAADEAPAAAVPYLTDEEMKRTYHRTAQLPPFKRVEERLRLLRDYPQLADWISSRVAAQRAEARAAVTTDFISRNKLGASAAAIEEREQHAAEARALQRRRTVRALEVARTNKKEGLSSEEAQRLRMHRRLRDLGRGWRGLLAERSRRRAQRWAVVLRVAHAATTMQRMARLARIVKRIRETSRTICAVRTVQRRFRERRIRRENQLRLGEIVQIQRVAKRFVYAMRRRKMGRAVTTLVGWLNGNERLSPLEMALKRFNLRVKLVQSFVRGFQAVTRGRLHLLRLQWRQLEHARLVEQYAHTSLVTGAQPAEAKKKGFEKGACSGQLFSTAGHKELGKVARAGQYAGVPVGMLDVPLPHVPASVRDKRLKKLLRQMRRSYVEEVITWDQKVMLQAERHPALIAGGRGVQRLAVIQHELHKDLPPAVLRKTASEKYASVLAIFDHMTDDDAAQRRRAAAAAPSHDALGGGAPAGVAPTRPLSVGRQMTKKMQTLNSSLSVQRRALEEIRAQIPRPHQRMLIRRSALVEAFEEVHARCTRDDHFESRPIRPPAPPAAAPSASRRGAAGAPRQERTRRPPPRARAGAVDGTGAIGARGRAGTGADAGRRRARADRRTTSAGGDCLGGGPATVAVSEAIRAHPSEMERAHFVRISRMVKHTGVVVDRVYCI